MITGENRNNRARRHARALAATLVTVAAFAALAVFGGLGGLASVSSSSAAEYEYETKVTICHRTGSAKKPTVTIVVNELTKNDHLAHGDTLGPC